MGDTLKALGAVIRTRRIGLGMTQAELAGIASETANIDPPSISRIERGKQGYPPEVLEGIARALRSTPAELLAEAEHQRPGQRQTAAPLVDDEKEIIANLRMMPPSVRRAACQLVAEMARYVAT